MIAGFSSAIAPNSVSGLQFWFKANSITNQVDGSAVSNWTDSSGNGYNSSQLIAANQPSYHTNSLNGQPVLYFDGSDVLATPSLSLDNFTMIILFSTVENAAKIVVEHGTDANTVAGHYLASSNAYTTLVHRTAKSGKILSSSWPGVNDYRLATQSYGDGLHANNLLYVDGQAASLSDAAEAANPLAGTVAAQVFIGGRSGPSFGLNGNIAELILYNQVLDSETRLGVECNLQIRYSQPLSSCTR